MFARVRIEFHINKENLHRNAHNSPKVHDLYRYTFVNFASLLHFSPSSGFHSMARMMDRMMNESLHPFGFARMTTRRNTHNNKDGDKSEPPRNGLRTERSDMRRERARNSSDTHDANGTRHPQTQSKSLGNIYFIVNNIFINMLPKILLYKNLYNTKCLL